MEEYHGALSKLNNKQRQIYRSKQDKMIGLVSMYTHIKKEVIQ